MEIKNQEQTLREIQSQIDEARKLTYKSPDILGEAADLLYKAADLMDLASSNCVKACTIISNVQDALEQPGLDPSSVLKVKGEAAELKALLDRLDSFFVRKVAHA